LVFGGMWGPVEGAGVVGLQVHVVGGLSAGVGGDEVAPGLVDLGTSAKRTVMSCLPGESLRGNR